MDFIILLDNKCILLIFIYFAFFLCSFMLQSVEYFLIVLLQIYFDGYQIFFGNYFVFEQNFCPSSYR